MLLKVKHCNALSSDFKLFKKRNFTQINAISIKTTNHMFSFLSQRIWTISQKLGDVTDSQAINMTPILHEEQNLHWQDLYGQTLHWPNS